MVLPAFPAVFPSLVRPAAAYVYLFVSLLLDSLAPVGAAMLSLGTHTVTLTPSMDAPFLARSIQVCNQLVIKHFRYEDSYACNKPSAQVQILGCSLCAVLRSRARTHTYCVSIILRKQQLYCMQEFWGRRYNLVVSCVLYDVVYWPIMHGTWVSPSTTLSQPKDHSCTDDSLSPRGEETAAGESQTGSKSVMGGGGMSEERGRSEVRHRRGVSVNGSSMAAGPSHSRGRSRSRRQGSTAGGTPVDKPDAAPSATAPEVPSGPQKGATGKDSSWNSSSSDIRAHSSTSPTCPSNTRRMVAIFASFLVSGFMHELSVW